MAQRITMAGYRDGSFFHQSFSALPSLVIKNCVRHLHRLALMGSALVVLFAILVPVNALLYASSQGFRNLYVNHIAGTHSISDIDAGEFTVFGSQALLIGEHDIWPTIAHAPEVLQALGAHDGLVSTGLVASRGRVEAPDAPAGRASQNQVLFGIDFPDYKAFFPDLQLTRGAWPDTPQPSILLQEERYQELLKAFDSDNIIGAKLIITGVTGNSFVIREVEIAGAFRYPVADNTLDRVALVSATTARSLNGYLVETSSSRELPDADKKLLETDLGDMFGMSDELDEDNQLNGTSELADSKIDSLFEQDNEPGRTATAAAPDPETESFVSVEALEDLFAQAQRTPVTQSDADGTWNFILVRGANSERDLHSMMAQSGLSTDNFLVRDWRNTVGGSAQIVFLLQIIMNVAIGFIAFGTLSVIVNSLVLSILERSKELGTLRAMGAQKSFVSLLIVGETVILVVTATVAGTALGVLLTAILNGFHIGLSNPLLATLFGTEVLKGLLTAELVVAHVLSGGAVALVALVYPLKRVLGISPLRAMSGEGLQ